MSISEIRKLENELGFEHFVFSFNEEKRVLQKKKCIKSLKHIKKIRKNSKRMREMDPDPKILKFMDKMFDKIFEYQSESEEEGDAGDFLGICNVDQDEGYHKLAGEDQFTNQ